MRIEDEVLAFLTSGVSITIASRSVNLVPSVARAKGCTARDAADTTILRIFISASQAGELLHDVQNTQAISATFSLPETHRTLQLKGTDARITELQPEDRQCMDAYVDTFAQRIAPFGFSAEFTRAFLASPDDEVAIEFAPTDAFLQTPGPKAGSRL